MNIAQALQVLDLNFGEFCKATELDEHDPETFRTWLIAISVAARMTRCRN